MWYGGVMYNGVSRFVSNSVHPLMDCAQDCYGNFCSRPLLKAADNTVSHPQKESNHRKTGS